MSEQTRRDLSRYAGQWGLTLNWLCDTVAVLTGPITNQTFDLDAGADTRAIARAIAEAGRTTERVYRDTDNYLD